MFDNRRQAGKVLAGKLVRYKSAPSTLVLGIPRGGVPVGKEIADKLNLPFDLIVTKKIGAPSQKELAIGAIGPGGKLVLDEELIKKLNIGRSYIEKEKSKNMKEIKRRLKVFGGGHIKTAMRDKTIILTDDGIATGSTIASAIKYLKNEKVKKIILAVPVAPRGTRKRFDGKVDEVVILETPNIFYAVGQFYRDFPQLSDSNVQKLIKARSR